QKTVADRKSYINDRTVPSDSTVPTAPCCPLSSCPDNARERRLVPFLVLCRPPTNGLVLRTTLPPLDPNQKKPWCFSSPLVARILTHRGRFFRAAPSGFVYPVLNCGDARRQLFFKKGDYRAFLRVLTEAKEEAPLRLLASCVPPNHGRHPDDRPEVAFRCGR